MIPVIELRGEIDSDSAQQFCAELAAARRSPGVEVRIDSNGGYVHAMNKICDAMRTFPGPITTVATGICASAACCIFLMGRTRKMTADAALMVHNATSAISGVETEKSRETSAQIAKLIALRSGVHERLVAEWMADEQYFDAKFALHWNLAHSLAPEHLQTSIPSAALCSAPTVSDKVRQMWWFKMREFDRRYKDATSGKRDMVATRSGALETQLRDVQRQMDEAAAEMRKLKKQAKPNAHSERRPGERGRPQPIVLPAGLLERVRHAHEHAVQRIGQLNPLARGGSGSISMPYGFAPGRGPY